MTYTNTLKLPCVTLQHIPAGPQGATGARGALELDTTAQRTDLATHNLSSNLQHQCHSLAYDINSNGLYSLQLDTDCILSLAQ